MFIIQHYNVLFLDKKEAEQFNKNVNKIVLEKHFSELVFNIDVNLVHFTSLHRTRISFSTKKDIEDFIVLRERIISFEIQSKTNELKFKEDEKLNEISFLTDEKFNMFNLISQRTKEKEKINIDLAKLMEIRDNLALISEISASLSEDELLKKLTEARFLNMRGII